MNKKERLVETVDGTMALRKNCRYIKGKYYEKNRQCVYINNKWYRKENKNVVYDHENSEWTLHSQSALVEGIVDIKDNGEVVYGHFSVNLYNNVTVFTGFTFKLCINPDKFPEKIKLHPQGFYYLYNADLNNISNHKDFAINKGHLPYNAEEVNSNFRETCYQYHKYPLEISKKARIMARYLEDISFGIEIETSKGYLPAHIMRRHGIIPCRDGSISGIEYVTVPLKGKKGLQNIYNFSKVLREVCTIDFGCSLHVHLGNLNLSKNQVISLYILAMRVQNSLFQMFPPYKKNKNGIGGKNYCKLLGDLGIKPLKNFKEPAYKIYIEDSWNRLFHLVTKTKNNPEGIGPNAVYNSKNFVHPRSGKWNQLGRYYYINFVNTVFSKSRTVEFRLHGPTLNSDKILTWLYMCIAMVKYSISHEKEILSSHEDMDVTTVFNYFSQRYPKNIYAQRLSKHLREYYEHMTKINDILRENGHMSDNRELSRDSSFSFDPYNILNFQ